MSATKSIAILLHALALAGCASTGSGSSANDTGLELSLFARDETGAEELYEVHRDGTISFGGGMKARVGTTTWKGEMTQPEIDQLRRLVREHGWATQDPPSTRQPPERRYRATISGREGRNSFTVKGESPRVRPVYDLLRRIALRRLDPDLEKLPKPSVEVEREK